MPYQWEANFWCFLVRNMEYSIYWFDIWILITRRRIEKPYLRQQLQLESLLTFIIWVCCSHRSAFPVSQIVKLKRDVMRITILASLEFFTVALCPALENRPLKLRLFSFRILKFSKLLFVTHIASNFSPLLSPNKVTDYEDAGARRPEPSFLSTRKGEWAEDGGVLGQVWSLRYLCAPPASLLLTTGHLTLYTVKRWFQANGLSIFSELVWINPVSISPK